MPIVKRIGWLLVGALIGAIRREHPHRGAVAAVTPRTSADRSPHCWHHRKRTGLLHQGYEDRCLLAISSLQG